MNLEHLNHNEMLKGMQDIQIEGPIWNEYRRVSITDFGARAEPGYCNGAAFQKAIDYCKQEGISELTVPRGVYHFHNGNHPKFDGLQDFLFNGGGSEFIFSTVSAYFVIRHCVRTVFQDFIVDWDWASEKLASIGQVQSVAADGLSFDLCFPEYDMVPEDLSIRTLNAMNPQTLTPGCELGREMNGNIFKKVLKKDSSSFRIELPRSEPFHFLRQGQAYIVRHFIYDANAFELHGNQHLRMNNVTIYSAPGHAFVTTGFQHHWILEHCRIVKRPGTTRSISVTADGCHISNSQGYFVIENCDFSYNGDDCLNIHDNSIQGFERINERTIQVNRVQGWRNPLDSGDPIEFRNPDLSPTGITAAITNVVWDEQNQQCTIEFGSPLSSELSDNVVLFNRRYNSGHYIVRNNFFHQNRARGILLHSSHGLVENNHFYMNQGSAIQIECGAESRWAEGYGVENVLIRNNLIESCDVNHWNMAVIYIGVYLDQGRTTYPIFQRISIENNTIVNCPQQAIYVSSCGEVSIRDNAIMNPNTGSVKTGLDGDENCVSNREYYRGSLMVSHSRDVVIENNRRLATIPTTEDHIYIDLDTSMNIIVMSNIGFR
ncbi:hypothetical protein J2T12_002922 [Paenibacillus anaericanus]|uniref:right-handed parallel beta-helix repeat-containing protein n=1 Tax=Paenibacillus anaericanus TaxID=170367 RepID=UPI002782D1AB|nr:right-handed parallel beta-helix repeat-containing protein [Paenibacillus anaericanus]MDQ0089510.1 hypothetical protein [Paenibacillus anaericanus]